MNEGKNGAEVITGVCAACGKPIARRASSVVGKMYCNRRCFKRPILDRFLALVDRSGGPDACHPFKGSMRGGYGQFPCIINGKQESIASRVSYLLMVGPIPAGKNIRHQCPNGHNPACCNPTHLTFGSQQENVDDSVKQGTHKYPFGTQCKKSDMTEAEVLYIKRRLFEGAPGHVICQETGRTKYTISDIKRGKTWKWLTFDPSKPQ